MTRHFVAAVMVCSALCLRVSRILTNTARSLELEDGLWRCVTIALGLLVVVTLGASAQSGPPLSFGNNYFVTGDYVVAGVGLRGLGVNGFATRQFTMPDANSVPAAGVPAGADIVAALLYWETVESSQTQFAGQNGFFRPVFSGGPATGYPITGAVLGNPNAPVSWSSGGCSGSSQGSKTMRTYSADVRAYLPQDSKGNILANGTYELRLADSGSNGGGAPLTLGASLVIVYRVLAPGLPLNSVVIYDGAFAPSNSSSSMSQTLQGFYQAGAGPISKLTHLVGNGQNNKFETVSLNGVNLPSLYGNLPPFPGFYNGSWDNPTWSLPNNGSNPVHANDASATTEVVPSPSNAGCVSWGAVVVSTTVQSSDNDGLVDAWKKNNPPGYCDASVNGGVCTTTDPSWVALPGATPGEKDLFVELDYMCSSVKPNGTCDTTNGYSFYPSSGAQTMITNAFLPHGINLHFIPGNAIQEQTCTDTTDSSGNPVLCPYPNQAGVVGWKAGFEFLKNQPLNYPDENSCQQALNGPCIRRFQHGRKDSYHYALFAHALGLPEWTLQDGSVASMVASGNTVTVTTSTPHGLTAGTDRVTIANAITNSSLNGTYMVQTASGNVFTITIPTATSATYTALTDPQLSVGSSRINTGSGYSDIGGADSLITLGLWGAAGQTDNVQAGTFMHELGHSNGLTHGGFYYDTPNSYVPTVEPNCKPNYQSVMSYSFQVDLLDNGVLDYSEQALSSLNENSLLGGVTTTEGSPLAYSTTKWYTPNAPGGVGTAAKYHCDGTPLSPNTDPNPTMYHVEGPANPITPEWVTPFSDINFDGTISTSLRGYNDWANLDLRQIGATGTDIAGGAGSHFGVAGGSHFGVAGGSHFGVAGGSHFGVAGGTGNGEFTFTTANSYVRPPRNVTSAVTAHHIQLNWLASTFSQIGAYNIYRSTDGATAVKINSVPGTSLTFTDLTVSCGPTYSYFVTAMLANADPPQESVQSNTTPAIAICNPTSTTVASSADPSIFGQSVTFTATVTNTGTGTATPTGSVQFYVDGAAFGAAVPLSGSGAAASGTSSATASLSVSGSPHAIKAVYTNIDGSFSGSSGTLSQTVTPAPTSTTVTSSLNPSIYGQSVTFTATVANTAGAGISTATPTGSVQFMDDLSLLGSPQNLSRLGTATLTTSTLAAGNHPITAVYTNTDGNFIGSTSTSFTQVVEDFSITATPSAQTIPSGHQALYSVTVTPIRGLTGTIALSCSGAPPNSTCSVSPSTDSLKGTGVTSTVTLSANKNVNHGTFTLTFTGALVGGNLNHSTTVQLTVK